MAAILDRGERGWFAGGSSGSQVELIQRVKLELGIEVAPMAMSRFLSALQGRGILRLEGDRGWRRDLAYDSVKEDFRLSAIGRASTYAGDHQQVEDALVESLGGRFARGVADVLSQETGAWIEPRDYLVDRSAIGLVQERLGGPVPRGYEGSVVVIRPALRVPLVLLTLGGPAIQTALGIAEALKMESPVAGQAAREAWERRSHGWR